ncbi:hypothetical protein B0H13DRAFT_2372763 [Mycena leptocephala]|nr:hypothetical protein B0H13DRAFT_2372763 [Mycena leptocephala]
MRFGDMRNPRTGLIKAISPAKSFILSPPFLMTRTSIPATNASNPAQELEALVAKIDSLTQLSLEMTRLCIEAQGVVPDITLSKQSLELTQACLDVKSQVRPVVNCVLAATAPESAPTPVAPPAPAIEWVRGVPLTPDQLDASFPAGVGDDLTWQVVCIGREPGLYLSPKQANPMLNGVPNQFRRKKGSRVEALAYYRLLYTHGEVQKWNEAVPPQVPPAAPTTPPVVPVESSPRPA